MNIWFESTRTGTLTVNVGVIVVTRRIVNISNKSKRAYKKGDLVCAYLMNSSYEVQLLQRGIVIDTNPTTDDIMVVDDSGYARWYPSSRWAVCVKEG